MKNGETCMPKLMSEKTVVITGATSGIGYYTALAAGIAEPGDDVENTLGETRLVDKFGKFQNG